VVLLAKFYVTTPVYYPTNPPHIGTAYTTIAADVLARWHRAKGDKVFFLTGTDEHGQKLQQAAEAAGLSPKEFVDRMVPRFKDAWKVLEISYDRFIRTTDPDHEAGVKAFARKLAKSDVYKGRYEGWYCVACETFYTEKDLVHEGSKLLDPVHRKPVERRSEETYFFRLSKYQKRLLKLLSRPGFLLPAGKREEMLARVREGLQDISITRPKERLAWGVEFALDPKHTAWVWIDALPNYLTATGWPKKGYDKWWPADLHVIGKEINFFHSVIWPALLLSAGLELPKHIFAHGWLTIEGQKMSKTLGNVVDPVAIASKYGADSIRYFLLRDISFGEDGDFSEKALIERHNSELADQLGNLVNRALVLAEKFSAGKVPKRTGQEHEVDSHLKDAAMEAQRLIEKQIGQVRLHDALAELWKLVAKGNAYVNETEPWKLEHERRVTVLYNLLETIRFIGVLVRPFLPKTGDNILGQLGLDAEEQDFSTLTTFGGLEPGLQTKRGDILFRKIETGGEKMPAVVKAKETKVKAQTKPEITIDDVAKLDLRVAEVKKAEDIKGSEKLVKLQIDIGGETKQIVAGIKGSYSPHELVGKQIIVVNNIKPREYKGFGVTSYAMLMAAEGPNGPVLLTTDRPVSAGAGIH
jgi:methionyl-tRNA synthetase